MDYWIGRNSTNPTGLKWDVIHFNFGLHDLETEGVGGPYATSPSNYTANLEWIWNRLAETGAKVIFATTTPVLFQTTPSGCKYCRNESSVVLYNRLARAALATAAAKTPATPLRINDIYGDVTAFCGVDYTRCVLQLAPGVHFTRMGREYTGLSVTVSILTACLVSEHSTPRSHRNRLHQHQSSSTRGSRGRGDAWFHCQCSNIRNNLQRHPR
jgi:acyl-CoA thioesterase-1